jgi:hypothetical protein
MKTLLRSSVLAASLAALSTTSQAQVLTADTITGFNAATAYSTGVDLTDPLAATQTFTNITAIELVTFRFIDDLAGSWGATMLNYPRGTWVGGNAAVQVGTTQSVNIDGSAGWTVDGSHRYFDAELDLSSFATSLNAATTYGLSIFGDNVSSNFRLAGASAAYGDGGGFTNNIAFANDFSSVTANNAPFANDFAFVGSLSAVPEASSAAVLFAGLFVGGLMCRRRRHVGSMQAQA